MRSGVDSVLGVQTAALLAALLGLLLPAIGMYVAVQIRRRSSDSRNVVRLDLGDGTVVSVEARRALNPNERRRVLEEALRKYAASEMADRTQAPSRQTLEGIIATSLDSEGAMPRVVAQLQDTNLLALGKPAGQVSTELGTVQGTESDLIHFTIGDEGAEVVFLPLFTNVDVLREALIRNPEWQELSVLEVNGGDLIKSVDEDVNLVINPWSRLEFQVPVEEVKKAASAARVPTALASESGSKPS